MATTRFDPEEYWRDKQYKCYVIILSAGEPVREKRDRFNIQARTQERAIACAKRQSLLKGAIRSFALLATPADLGADVNGYWDRWLKSLQKSEKE
jgi:hypothetical protein